MKKTRMLLLFMLTFLLTGCTNQQEMISETETVENIATESSSTEDIVSDADSELIQLDSIPEYEGMPYATINNNEPFFSAEDKLRTDAFEYYSELDDLGRCGVAYANICKELQPTEERGEIGSVKPSGWQTVKYNGYIEGNYLYNRCHLIGYQLAGENANEKNLITGTRYMNCDGQLPFEDKVDDYVDSTNNHVLYRVTPIYDGNNLVASGVLTEIYSVEDNGEGLKYCVYCYNVQPGIGIDYATGDSWFIDDYTGEYATTTYFSTKQVKNYAAFAYGNGETAETAEPAETENETNGSVDMTYILNTSTKKFHNPDCRYAKEISESNREDVVISRDELLSEGYYPCRVCNP